VRGNVILDISGKAAISILLEQNMSEKGEVYARVGLGGEVVGVYKVLAGDPGRASLALDCVHDLAEGMDIMFGRLADVGVGSAEGVAFECLEIPSDEGYTEANKEAGDGGDLKVNEVMAGSECGIVTRNPFGKTEISTIPGVKCIIESI
jgi:hypothetical protein